MNLDTLTIFLKSNTTCYIAVIISVLALAYAISLSAENRYSLKQKLITLPVISVLLLIIFGVSLYNMLAAMICIFAVCIILALPTTSATLEHFSGAKADSDSHDENENGDEDADEDEDEAYNSGDSASAKDVLPTVKSPSASPSATEAPTLKRNQLSKAIGIYDNKYSEMFNTAIQENKKVIRKRMKTVRNNNRRHEGGKTNTRENYSDSETKGGGGGGGGGVGDLAIQRRKFNLNDANDKDLINTREICTDIINRINYEYEDNEYLKKYISSRVEEIIEINKLLDDD
jgi:hypothetical protein